MSFEILYQDEQCVAIQKPSGFHVHPHEDRRNRVERDRICLYVLRDQLGQYVYPVHRLDAGTSGVLLFALSSEAARALSRMFAEKKVAKTYHAVVRGYAPTSGEITLPLELDSTGDLVEARTDFRRLGTVEFPVVVAKRFPTARYSWVEARPQTGRWHQIRRHFNRISHPLIGDADHGDCRQNRFFRNELGIAGLCLKAKTLELALPWHNGGTLLKLEAPPCEKWEKIEALFAAPSLETGEPGRLLPQ